MNYSVSELSDDSLPATELDAQVTECAGQLPALGRALHSAILDLSHELEVSPTQVKVLLQLTRCSQMTIGEIADALSISMPAASETVDRLVETGHVQRTTDASDRRRVLVSASPAAARAIAQLRELRQAQVRRALLRLEPDERPVASRILAALIAELGDAEAVCTGVAGRSSSLA